MWTPRFELVLLLGSLALAAGFAPRAARRHQQQPLAARLGTPADVPAAAAPAPSEHPQTIARRGALLGALATVAALPRGAHALGFELKENPQNSAVVGAVQGVLDANPFSGKRQEERAKKSSGGGGIAPAASTPRKSSKEIMDEINAKRNGPTSPRPAPRVVAE